MSLRSLLAAIIALALFGCGDGGSSDNAGGETAPTLVAPSEVVSSSGTRLPTASTVMDTAREGTYPEVTLEELIAKVGTSLRSEHGVTTLAARMAELSVPGVAVSVVTDGAVLGSFVSGVTPDGHPMTSSTLTQVGSVSKPIAAVGALRMVVDGELPWDDDITPLLVSYPLPPGRQSADHPVTVAALLSHTAGATVHGFPGYQHPSDAAATAGGARRRGQHTGGAGGHRARQAFVFGRRLRTRRTDDARREWRRQLRHLDA